MSHAKQLHHRRSLHDSLEILNREGLPGNVKTDLCLRVQDTVITTVHHVIEAALDEELHAYLGLDRMNMCPGGAHPRRPAVGAISAPCSRSTAPLPTCTCPNGAGGTARCPGNTTWKVIREIWGDQKVLFFEINRLWKRP